MDSGIVEVAKRKKIKIEIKNGGEKKNYLQKSIRKEETNI